MTILEFKDKIGEVERFYSKEYVNEQKNELYRYFKEYTLKQFAYIISKVYQKCKYLPSIAEIIEIEKEIPFSKIRKTEKTDCKNCIRGFALAPFFAGCWNTPCFRFSEVFVSCLTRTIRTRKWMRTRVLFRRYIRTVVI